MRPFLPTALLALAWVLFLSKPLGAEEPQIVVSSNAPVSLSVNGAEVQGLPAVARPGSEVCITKRLYYVSEGERFRFIRWQYPIEGEPSSTNYAPDPCLRVKTPASYSALYDPEVLLLVRSRVKAYQQSLWVPRGELAEISVPEVVNEGDGVRFRFEEWSGGETPFKPANSIAALRPSVLEVKWTREYYVRLVRSEVEGTEEPMGVTEPAVPASGSGWYAEGNALVLTATPEIYDPGGKSRLKFEKWESVGSTPLVVPNVQSPVTSITVDAPYTLRSSYRREYLVVAQNFQGTLKREWVPEGEEVVLETPAMVETISEQERYVFKRWEETPLTPPLARGDTGGSSPKANLAVDRPVHLNAVYERQFMVNVSAPFGASAGGWYAEGATAKVAVPKNPQSILFLKKVFNGFPGYTTKGPVLEVPVREPMTITPIYSTKVDWKVLGLLLFVLVIGLLVYLITQRARSSYY